MKLREGHNALVIPPLLAALLFCFVLILIHAPSASTGEAAATAKQTQQATKQNALPAIPDVSQPTLPAIDDTVVTVDPATTGGTSNIKTATPQPTNSHSSSDLQSASSNQGNGKKITVPSSSIYQRVINKL